VAPHHRTYTVCTPSEIALMQLTQHVSAHKKKFHPLCHQISFTYDYWPIPRSKKPATSHAYPGRRIERVGGSDRASIDHFAKKTLNFIEINPQYEKRSLAPGQRQDPELRWGGGPPVQRHGARAATGSGTRGRERRRAGEGPRE
jgi:hypothetical protein